MSTLSKQAINILWRIWYIYLISLLTHRGCIAGLSFGASIMIFRELVFVRMVIKNLLSVEVGKVPSYIWGVLMQAEAAKLLALACMIASVWLLVIQLRHAKQRYPLQLA